ncbi:MULTISPECIES: TetR/AcrR family transcriptional regulator [unclassified Streptomyces]|uniref:TetR/AcrR family transcriptional regulator n=1 Tax=unclassified Streptomyces TaxID=2593676 RepID=UPI00278C7942|nr:MULTISPECIES: TetR/AcrR family transcriptional regulator [unclassified Streptomyces]
MGTSTDTRRRLIDVAERLFAEQGIHATSLREIAAAADQRNTSAVAYHFGTKRGLVDAIYEERLTVTTARQLELLEELDARGRGTELRALTQVLVRPMVERLEHPERPSWFLRFVVNAMYVEGIAPTDLRAHPWTRGLLTLHTRISRCMPKLPARVRENRWDFFIGLLLHTLAQRERTLQASGAPDVADQRLLAADLIDAGVAVLTAQVTPVRW